MCIDSNNNTWVLAICWYDCDSNDGLAGRLTATSMSIIIGFVNVDLHAFCVFAFSRPIDWNTVFWFVLLLFFLVSVVGSFVYVDLNCRNVTLNANHTTLSANVWVFAFKLVCKV